MLQNAAEKPPFFLPSWTAMYVVNTFVVVWVLVVGFGFGGWASMTNFVRQVDTFGLFAKCYQCKPPTPQHPSAPPHHWAHSEFNSHRVTKPDTLPLPPYFVSYMGRLQYSPLQCDVMFAGFSPFFDFLFFFFNLLDKIVCWIVMIPLLSKHWLIKIKYIFSFFFFGAFLFLSLFLLGYYKNWVVFPPWQCHYY